MRFSNFSQRRPLTTEQDRELRWTGTIILFNIEEVLKCDLEAEYSARALYKEAREVCREAGDYVTMELFEGLLKDEEGHIDFIETELELLQNIGVQNYGQLQATSADQAE